MMLYVAGDPKGQPRVRHAAYIGRDGMAHGRLYTPGTAMGFKDRIRLAAMPHRPHTRPTGPFRVDVVAMFARPKSHYRTGRYSHALRPDAPRWHTSRPDIDNVEKAVYDVLAELGFWRDDAQVCDGHTVKVYSDQPGCRITITPLGGDEDIA